MEIVVVILLIIIFWLTICAPAIANIYWLRKVNKEKKKEYEKK